MKNQRVVDHLLQMIKDEKIDDFFRTLSEFLKPHEETLSNEYDQLKHQWERNQFSKKMGKLPEDQSISSFSSVFKRFAKDVLYKLPENKKLIQNLILEKETTLTSNNKSNPPLVNKLKESNADKIGVRPIFYTVICILSAILLFLSSLTLIVVQSTVEFNASSIFLSFIQISLFIIHIVGLWKMRKWSIISYIMNFSITVITMLFSYAGSYKDHNNMYFPQIPDSIFVLVITLQILLTLSYWFMLGYYYKRMT